MNFPRSIPINPFTLSLVYLIVLNLSFIVAKLTFDWFEVPVSGWIERNFNSNKQQIKHHSS